MRFIEYLTEKRRAEASYKLKIKMLIDGKQAEEVDARGGLAAAVAYYTADQQAYLFKLKQRYGLL